MDSQLTNTDSVAPHTQVLHINKDSQTHSLVAHDNVGNTSAYDMDEHPARGCLENKITTVAPSISPKAQDQSTTSPKISRSPSLGITVQKGPQRSQSSMSNHPPLSPSLSRQVSSSSLRGNDAATTSRQAPRRSFSGLPHSSPVRAPSRASLNVPAIEPQSITATSVAQSYLERELAVHQDETIGSDTVVILHDDCYGHRYSRPKTTKGTLSTIVERPERLQASVLGLSAAYIRLGGRHSEGRQPPHPERDIDRHLPFLIHKTARAIDISSSYVTNVHGKAWMEELKTMCNAASANLASTGKELARTPNGASQSDSPPKQTLHEGDLYLSSESLNALQGALGGVCEGVDAIFQNTTRDKGPSKAFVCIRPPGHHCSSDLPSGFCWLNNVHVGIEYAAQNHGLTHAVILDFDLHHGDGSQSITWARNSRIAKMPKNTTAAKRLAIGYYSLHDINSFPCEWGEDEKVQNASLCIENAHNQSVWNVHLEPWKIEADFWNLYEKKYSVLLEKARNFLKFHADRLRNSSGSVEPKAAIFLSAGFDASQWEGQGMQRHKVNVPTDFFARFTEDAVKLAQESGLGADGRVISVLEGGYSGKALISGVMSHVSGLISGGRQPEIADAGTLDGLGTEMGRRMGALSLEDQQSAPEEPNQPGYSSSWWNLENLTALEGLISAPPPAPAAKRRTTANNTSHYTSPTQSFTAKVVDPTKIYRSPSGYSTLPLTPLETAAPPVPDVDWLTAVGELSKLLIPQNRQTKSCRPEELSEPRVKKERQSINTLPSAESSLPAGRMQLRERKAKVSNYSDPKSDDESVSTKAPSRANRRRTIGDISSISEKDSPPTLPQIPLQQANGPPKAEDTLKPRPESVINVVPAPKATKISIKAQKKPANTVGSSVAGRKKGSEKSTAPSRTKSKTSKMQPLSTSSNSIPKKGTDTATAQSKSSANGSARTPQPPETTDPDIDQITSSMENKLSIGDRQSENSKDEVSKAESTDPVQLFEDPVQQRSELQVAPASISGTSSHPVVEERAVEYDQQRLSAKESDEKDFKPAPTGIATVGSTDTTNAPLADPSGSISNGTMHQTQSLLSSYGAPVSNGKIVAPDAPVANQDVFNVPMPSQAATGIQLQLQPDYFDRPTIPYGGFHFHGSVNELPGGQALPMFSSQGHIPFGQHQANQQSDHPPSASYRTSEEQGFGLQDTRGSSPGHEVAPAPTGSAVGPPVTQGRPANENGLAAARHPSPGPEQQIPSDTQPFSDLPAVPDIWDVPDTPER